MILSHYEDMWSVEAAPFRMKLSCAFTVRLVKLLPVWLISQCFISVKEACKVESHSLSSLHKCAFTHMHAKYCYGICTSARASEMAKTYGLIIILLALLEIFLLTDSKGIVPTCILIYSLYSIDKLFFFATLGI